MRIKNEGQSFVEFSLFTAIAVTVVIVMATMVQRGLQGKVRDAGEYMHSQVLQTAQSTGAVGVYYNGYEPYYVDSNATIFQRSDDQTYLRDAKLGVYNQIMNQHTSATMSSYQLPPGMGTIYDNL